MERREESRDGRLAMPIKLLPRYSMRAPVDDDKFVGRDIACSITTCGSDKIFRSSRFDNWLLFVRAVACFARDKKLSTQSHNLVEFEALRELLAMRFGSYERDAAPGTSAGQGYCTIGRPPISRLKDAGVLICLNIFCVNACVHGKSYATSINHQRCTCAAVCKVYANET